MGIPAEHISSRIFVLREQRIMLDADLADLYRVPTKVLVQAVRRNLDRFPSDFLFRLTQQELGVLRSQIVTSSSDRNPWGGRRSLPFAFTEQGVAMLSSVLRSARAIAVNITIMRAFVRLRQLAAANTELARKLDDLERRVCGHDEASQASCARSGISPLRFLRQSVGSDSSSWRAARGLIGVNTQAW
jgi:hypothetical protein